MVVADQTLVAEAGGRDLGVVLCLAEGGRPKGSQSNSTSVDVDVARHRPMQLPRNRNGL